MNQEELEKYRKKTDKKILEEYEHWRSYITYGYDKDALDRYNELILKGLSPEEASHQAIEEDIASRKNA